MDPIIIEPKDGLAAESVVIWLHGLGADGHDFESIVPELKLDFPIRYIFPTAKIQPVTVNGGMDMRAWYDIKQVDLMQQVDWEGIQASVEWIGALIESQIQQGIPSDKILLAGFSQGGLIALYSGLTFSQPLAGVMALSTYFPLSDRAVKQATTLPIMLAHGVQDPVCPLAIAETSCQNLQAMGFTPDWQTYPMQHQVCLAEIEAMAVFIRTCLGTV